jgi:hypothetical protein
VLARLPEKQYHQHNRAGHEQIIQPRKYTFDEALDIVHGILLNAVCKDILPKKARDSAVLFNAVHIHSRHGISTVRG